MYGYPTDLLGPRRWMWRRNTLRRDCWWTPQVCNWMCSEWILIFLIFTWWSTCCQHVVKAQVSWMSFILKLIQVDPPLLRRIGGSKRLQCPIDSWWIHWFMVDHGIWMVDHSQEWWNINGWDIQFIYIYTHISLYIIVNNHQISVVQPYFFIFHSTTINWWLFH